MPTADSDRLRMMPAHFGPRAQPPEGASWRYHDVTAISVSYLTDPDQLARYLPEPFVVGDEARISVFYAQNRRVDWLAGRGYNMIGVNASAVFAGADDRVSGNFALVVWENLTDPILTGRELQGIPKVFADIPDHTVMDGTWRAAGANYGHPIVSLEASDLRTPTDEEMELGRQAADAAVPMGWRHIPGLGGDGVTISEATTYGSRSDVDWALVGAGRVEWHRLTWEQNPTQSHIVNALAALPIGDFGPAIVTHGSADLSGTDHPTRALS